MNEEFQAGTASIDFRRVNAVIDDSEPCYILYRDKEFTLPSAWILIVYIPQSANVNLKMIYASSKSSLKDGLGRNNFSKVKEFDTSDEVSWKNIQQVSNPINEPKPWSKREIIIRELEDQENIARKEIIDNSTSEQPSGFTQMSIPMTASAEQSLNKLKNKQINWVQLTLGDNFDQIDCVNSKTIGENDLVNNIFFDEPQFYLFDLNGNIVLIYCCPEEGTNIRNRMVYSTCKATLADQVRSMGVAVVKKFDVRNRDEINISNLRAETNRKAAVYFRATHNMISNSNVAEERNENPRSRFLNTEAPQVGTAFTIRTEEGSNKPKQLPKGVVLPPPGAYM